jgi:ATP-dependent protease HslVU (ClpYQ) ATPase subunit
VFSGNIPINVELNPITNNRMDKVLISSEKDATIINKPINIIEVLKSIAVLPTPKSLI